MAADRAIPRNFGVGASVLAAAALAFSIAGNLKIQAAAILTFVTMIPFVLYSPAAAALTWLCTGPILGGSVAVVLGRGLPAITVDRVILAFLVAACILRWLRDPSRFLRPGRIEILMAVFVGVAVLSLLTKGPGDQIPGGGGLRADLISLIQSYVTPYVGFVLGKNLITGRRQRESLLWVITCVGVVIALVAIVNHYTGSTLLRPTRYEITHEGRATGTLSSAPHFGLLMALSLFPAIVLLLRARAPRPVFFLTAAIGIMFLAIYLGKTRSSYVGLYVGLTAAAFFDSRLKRILIGLSLALVMLLVVGWSALMQADFVQQRILDPYPIYNRIALAATGANMVVHNPILGIGFGTSTFAAHRSQYLSGFAGVAREYAVYSNPHNDYLEILVLLGILGFAPYCGILYFSFQSCVRNLRSRDEWNLIDRDVALVALASLTCYLEQGLFGGLSSVWYASNVVFVLLGVVQRQLVDRGESLALQETH